MPVDSRYHRQVILPEIGALGQERIRNAKVLVVGVGGLGCPAALYLSAAGVGTLGLVDPDRVDLTNLHRQILFCESRIGEPKVEAAKRELLARNAGVNIRTWQERLSPDSAQAILREGWDVLVDGTDNFASKFFLSDIACRFRLAHSYGSISRFEGQAALFDSKSGPCYRCLYPAMPKAKIRNCAEDGVIGAVAGVVGSLQAAQTLMYIAKASEGLSGVLSSLDLLSGELRRFAIQKRPGCAECDPAHLRDQHRSRTLPRWEDAGPALGYAAACSSAPEEIDLPTCLKKLQAGDSICFVDVRESEEWRQVRIPGALHWPLSALRRDEEGPRSGVSENSLVVVVCRSGVRSLEGVLRLREHGIENLVSLRGGILAWEAAGQPVQSGG